MGRQCSCIGVLALIASIAYVVFGITVITFAADDFDWSYGFIYGLFCLQLGLATLYIHVRDAGDHLVHETGPCRWMLCGFGVEKVRYEDVYHYSVSRSCFYGFGLPCCTSI